VILEKCEIMNEDMKKLGEIPTLFTSDPDKPMLGETIMEMEKELKEEKKESCLWDWHCPIDGKVCPTCSINGGIPRCVDWSKV
jgi:hypothetical protein